MSVISMFYGLIVRMFFFDTDKHRMPHIHVEYGEFAVVPAIADGDVLAEEIPKAKLKLVHAWMKIHRDELLADWTLAMEGREVFKIDPLK